MQPYKNNIKSFDDVRQEYPQVFDLTLLNNVFCKECIKKENEIIRSKIKHESGRHRIRTEEIKELVEARGLYRFLFCIDHLLDQSMSLGTKGDILVLIKRCKRFGCDPWNPHSKALYDADRKAKSKLDNFLKQKGRYVDQHYEITDREDDDTEDLYL